MANTINNPIDFSKFLLGERLELYALGLKAENMPALVSFLESHTEIKSVDLLRNNIGPSGAKTLAQLTTKLTWLNVRENHIQGVGVAALKTNPDIHFDASFEDYLDYERPEQLSEVQNIPKSLHFIWLGGELPTYYQQTVERWKSLNPDYRVIVWYDRDFIKRVQLDHFKKWGNEHDIHILDLDDVLGINPHAKYEAAGPVVNMGAASDIRRLQILYCEGGVYLDVDIKPTRFPINLISLHAKHGILFTDFTKYEQVGFGKIRNDLIAAVPGHPFLEYIYKKINDQYEKHYELISDSNLYVTHNKNELLNYVSLKTGLEFFADNVIQFYKSEIRTYTNYGCIQFKDPSYYFPFKSCQCFSADKNDESWLNTKGELSKRIYEDESEVANDIFIRMKYEIIQRGILNIPFYLMSLASNMDKLKVTQLIFDKILSDEKLIKKIKTIKSPNEISLLFSNSTISAAKWKDFMDNKGQ